MSIVSPFGGGGGRKLLLVTLIIFLFNPNHLHPQSDFEIWEDLVVESGGGEALKMPWVGGLNNPQFSGADLDNDEKEDLFVFDRYDNNILAFKNNGESGEINYSYAPNLVKKFPPLKNWALLRDFNCDNVPDIFTGFDDAIRVYEGSWENNLLTFSLFTEKINYNGLNVLPVVETDLPNISDVNGDGYIDILTFDPDGGYVWWLKNISNNCNEMNFELADSCWGNFYESGITAELELNNFCGGGKNGVHPGSTLMTYDSNGDGVKELVLGDINFDNLVMVENEGTPETANAIAQDINFPNNSVSVDVVSFPAAFLVDVNNDGLNDMIASPNSRVLSEHTECAWLYLNEGSESNTQFSFNKKTFLVDEMIDVGRGAHPAFFDYNGDGLQDLVIGNDGSTVVGSVSRVSSLYLYENIGTPNNPRFKFVTNDYLNLADDKMLGLTPSFGDVNGDGAIDLVMGAAGSNVADQSLINGALIYLRNTAPANEPPLFANPVYFWKNIDIGQHSAPQIVDVNGDGLNDLIIGEKLGKLNYFKNTGTPSSPSFTEISTFWGEVDVRDSTGTGYSTPQLIELYGDGEMYLVVGNGEGKVYVFGDISEDGGAFTLIDNDLLGSKNGIRINPHLADINDDNRWDMVVGDYRGGIIPYTSTLNTSLTEFEKATINITPYPNPSSDFIFIKNPPKTPSIANNTTSTNQNSTSSFLNFDYLVHFYSLYNIKGQLLKSNNCKNSSFLKIDVSNYESGTYFMKLVGENNESVTKKILVQR